MQCGLPRIHLNPKRSVLSSPLTVAAALASRTSRIKLGIAVQVLPLAHPLHLAEDAATVDQISQGRLIFGVGRSGNVKNYASFGVPYAESRGRFWETLEIIRLAWTEPSFTFDGEFYKIPKTSLAPKTFQKPMAEIRVAATSPDNFPVIGKLGYPIFVAIRKGSLAALEPDIRAYRAAWREAGHPGEGEVYLRLPMYVADTEEQAREEPRASIMQAYDSMAERTEAYVGGPMASLTEQNKVAYDEALRDKVIVGTPKQVVDRLQAVRTELGLNGILAELNFGSKIPHAQVMRALELMCKEVMPSFQ